MEQCKVRPSPQRGVRIFLRNSSRDACPSTFVTRRHFAPRPGCQLIVPGKKPELEQLIEFLQKRSESADFRAQARSASKKKKRSLREANRNAGLKASVTDIDDYQQLLYDEIPDKLRGTGLILQACFLLFPVTVRRAPRASCAMRWAEPL